MNYHPDDFLALSTAVEAEGGKNLAGECQGYEYRIKLPDNTNRMNWRKRWTTGCGFAARMAIPYDPTTHIRIVEDDTLDPEPVTVCDVDGDVGSGSVIACAVDDAVGLWPRFKGVCSSRSYQSLFELPREFRVE